MSRLHRHGLRALLLLAGVGLVGTARAADDKRPVPDYDGRGGPPQSPGRKALWIPRILLSPVYFVSEFVVRRPLAAGITAAEKAQLPKALYDFFAFGPDHSAGIVPIAFIDFGFQPSVGLYGFWDDVGFKGHDLRLRGSTGGTDWLSGTATERFTYGEQLELTLTGTATRRPDYAFYGIGPDTLESALVRYSADTVDTRFESRLHFWGGSVLDSALGYRGASFGHSDFDEDGRGTATFETSLDDAIASGQQPEPPGFRDGYRAPFVQTRLTLDSRGKSASATGTRLELAGEQGTDLKNSPTSAWLRCGATLGGFLDLADSGRVVSLALSAQLADPLGDRPVPFTELVRLGGPGLMPGFREGRLFDRSALVATLRYSWPIWIWLNGSLQAATGNVFGKHFDGAKLQRSRFSAALGIEANSSRDSIFQALVGFGTETFESGAKLDSIRLVIGARSGF